MAWVRKIAMWSLAAIYVVALLLVGVYLFFPDQVMFFVNYVNPPIEFHGSSDQIVVGYAFKPVSLDPTAFDAVTRSYLGDLYEGLVQTDRDLNIKPALAVSWGLLDATTWEFRLRPGVKFHDGSNMTANDVVASIERARSAKESQLVNLLSTIRSVQAVGMDRVWVKTIAPDPNLLSKMAVTYIYPSKLKQFDKPLGTGPYAFAGYSEDGLALVAFSDYWGHKPYFHKVLLKFIPDRTERIKALEKGDIQLLANVPPNYACSKTEKYQHAPGCHVIKNKKIMIKAIPSLEVSFLVFNHKNKLFSRRAVREAVSRIIDQSDFVDLAFGFARPVGQFVSNGVFGFNPDITKLSCQPEESKKKFAAACADIFEAIEVMFDYPENLETIGEYVKSVLNDLGFSVELNPLRSEDLQKKIVDGDSDLFFMGWRSELGGALDFLQSVVHTKDPARGYGLYNGAHYSNKQVDALIESAEHNLDEQSRLQQLQDAMKLVVDDIYGVPLYESMTIFGFYDYLDFNPRVDGYIRVADISEKLNKL